MSVQANPYPLRLDKEIMEKTKIIAKFNGRSVNKEIEFSLRAMINKYEEENGAIPVESSFEDE